MLSTQCTSSGLGSTLGRSRLTTTGSCPLRHSTHDSGSVVARVDLLVRHERRHVDEVAGPGFGGELEPIAPLHPRAAADHVDHAFHGAVMMRARLGLGMDDHRPGPELLRAGARMRDRRRAIHAGRLRGVGVELVARDDAHAVQPPFGLLSSPASLTHRLIRRNRGRASCARRPRIPRACTESRACCALQPGSRNGVLTGGVRGERRACASARATARRSDV